MTKFKSQVLHIIRIKYLNASGSGSPPFLIPALWNIGILFHKQVKRWTIMHTTVHMRTTVQQRKTRWSNFVGFSKILNYGSFIICNFSM